MPCDLGAWLQQRISIKGKQALLHSNSTVSNFTQHFKLLPASPASGSPAPLLSAVASMSYGNNGGWQGISLH